MWTMSTAHINPTDGVLPQTLSLGAVHLVIHDLDRSVAWYQRVLGLHVMSREAGTARLGDGDVATVVLHEDPDATPADRHAGIYHYALLFPDRAELGRAAVRLAALREPIDGASDHRTHEAIYLRDPDGIGIELAADRPREEWPTDLGYASGPAPLDVEGLLSVVAGEPMRDLVGPGLRMGHVHLHVRDIPDTVAFYRDRLGLHVTADLGSAVFFAAGDYHHHVGANVWRGTGIPAQREGAIGLRHWTIELASADRVAAVRERLTAAGVTNSDHDAGVLVRDPAGIPILITHSN